MRRFTSGTSARLWEIDALRGVAILMMVVYHLMWDLLAFGFVDGIALQQGFWKYFQRTTASTFIFLVGISLAVGVQQRSARRTTDWHTQRRGLTFSGWQPFIWRGLKIFAWGILLTVIVRLADIGNIEFGVLHLIGLSVIFAYPFMLFKWINIGLWLLLNFVGQWMQQPLAEGYWLIWLGLQPPNYWYLDYFPLIPWFGVVLLGIGVGNLLYPNGAWRQHLPLVADMLVVQGLRWLGMNSLIIYLLHQPILIGILVLAPLFIDWG